jgi:hypothetical protein
MARAAWKTSAGAAALALDAELVWASCKSGSPPVDVALPVIAVVLPYR